MILLASFHFGHSELGWNGGEQVWARSMLSAFRELNHTLLFSWGHMDTLLNYQAIPELVTHVLWERGEFLICERRNDTNYREMDKADYTTQPWHNWQTGPKRCMQTDDYPQGIPYWKSFHFWFFVETDHPLGGNWILSPEDYDLWYGTKPNHTYLGELAAGSGLTSQATRSRTVASCSQPSSTASTGGSSLPRPSATLSRRSTASTTSSVRRATASAPSRKEARTSSSISSRPLARKATTLRTPTSARLAA